MEDEEKTDGQELTIKQEAFCRNYTQNTELFGNGTLSYALAYGYDLYNADDGDKLLEFPSGLQITETEKEDREFKGEKFEEKYRTIRESTYKRMESTCAVSASQLLRNPKIDARIIVLLNEMMKEEQIDAEIIKVIKQNHDLPSKMRAIGEFNKLKQRIVEKKEVKHSGEVVGIEFIRNDGGDTKNKDTNTSDS